MRAARFLLLIAALLAAPCASAGVQALLACRQLPAGQGRVDCLERESAQLERELAAQPARAAAPAPTLQGVRPIAAAQAGHEAESALRVIGIDYVDGRPLIALANGERWQAREQRRLTMLADGNVATLEHSPGGMVMHFNRSFYGLHVQRLP